MNKFRCLTLEELELLKKEFIDFLAVNTITGDDWEKIKKSEPEKQQRTIELFSEVVFTKILREIKFLELHTSDLVSAIQCNASEMILISAEKVGEEAKIFSTNKPYTKDREEELFDLMNQGFVKSDGKLFKQLWLTIVG